jgi:hypothetical protein
MFKPRESSQSEYEFLSFDELVPDDHLLRLIDKYIDFSFLLEKVLPINFVRKKLSEASQTQKSCMGFATAGYGD